MMKDDKIEKIIPKLVKYGFMSYDVKPDGQLVVIDGTGRKRFFAKEEYQDLLRAKPKTVRSRVKPDVEVKSKKGK